MVQSRKNICVDRDTKKCCLLNVNGGFMFGIDEIMEMLKCDNPKSVQEKGIELARKIECFNVFIQPVTKNYNINVWENCAIIISEKTDEQLRPYVFELLMWLRDMNWPGFFTIFKRLKNHKYITERTHVINDSISFAKSLNDEEWLSHLKELNSQ